MNLAVEIEKKRNEMISAGISMGFMNETTIKVSRELDKLINQSIAIKHSHLK